MSNLGKSREVLLQEIADTEAHLFQLRQELERTENPTRREPENVDNKDTEERRWPLLQEEYKRYGRQMILDQIGLEGQLKLRDCAVLIVGAGGLGCPAAMYLAGAGIGSIGLVDGDTVEESNLHRQVLHRTKNVGKFKVDSAIEYLQELNSHPKYIAYRKHLTPQDAPDLFASFDVILDCTDNPASRYLISDTAVLLGKPLISASALRTEGQLMVLNYPPWPQGNVSGGPCYRCIFPKPPPADSVVRCADGGILGPVVGLMGVMQALETIRVITTEPIPLDPIGQAPPSPCKTPITPALHLFSAYSSPPFRTIRLRPRRANCTACSVNATIMLDSLRSGLTDYIQFCGFTSPVSLLLPNERISASEYSKVCPSHYAPVHPSTDDSEASKPIVIDVREAVQYGICCLPNSVNIPMSAILASPPALSQSQHRCDGSETGLPSWYPTFVLSTFPERPIYVVCRLGNDSQVAVKKLKELGADRGGKRFVGDIRGGFRAWREEVDPEWPNY